MINFSKNDIFLTGRLNLSVYKDDILFFEYESKNLVVNSGKTLVTNLLVGNNVDNKKISKYAIGSSNIAPDSMQTELQGLSTYSNNISGFSFSSYNTVTINFSVQKTQGNGISVKEFGLFSADGTMYNRVIWDRNLIKSNSFMLSGSFIITIN